MNAETVRELDRHALLAMAKNGVRFMADKRISLWVKIGIFFVYVVAFVAYIFWPADLINDFIPVLGKVDDASGIAPMIVITVRSWMKTRVLKMLNDRTLDALAESQPLPVSTRPL